jgi:hypothetical protein
VPDEMSPPKIVLIPASMASPSSYKVRSQGNSVLSISWLTGGHSYGHGQLGHGFGGGPNNRFMSDRHQVMHIGNMNNESKRSIFSG